MARSANTSWRITFGAIAFFFLTGIILVGVMFSKKMPIDYYEQGISDYQKGQYAAAVKDFHQDVLHNPNHSLGHYYLGKSLLKIGNQKQANEAFMQAYQTSLHGPAPDPAFAAKCYVAAQQVRQ